MEQTMMRTMEQTMMRTMEQTMTTMMRTMEQTMTTMMRTMVIMEMAVKEKAAEEKAVKTNLGVAKLLAEKTLVMSAADTRASAGFFIADRHIMKIQKVYL
jgi:20S proteasome alpha/beta subunit